MQRTTDDGILQTYNGQTSIDFYGCGGVVCIFYPYLIVQYCFVVKALLDVFAWVSWGATNSSADRAFFSNTIVNDTTIP